MIFLIFTILNLCLRLFQLFISLSSCGTIPSVLRGLINNSEPDLESLPQVPLSIQVPWKYQLPLDLAGQEQCGQQQQHCDGKRYDRQQRGSGHRRPPLCQPRPLHDHDSRHVRRGDELFGS